MESRSLVAESTPPPGEPRSRREKCNVEGQSHLGKQCQRQI